MAAIPIRSGAMAPILRLSSGLGHEFNNLMQTTVGALQLIQKLNEAGTTIIQVTHSEANAAYGSRVVQLRDGWVVDE